MCACFLLSVLVTAHGQIRHHRTKHQHADKQNQNQNNHHFSLLVCVILFIRLNFPRRNNLWRLCRFSCFEHVSVAQYTQTCRFSLLCLVILKTYRSSGLLHSGFSTLVYQQTDKSCHPCKEFVSKECCGILTRLTIREGWRKTQTPMTYVEVIHESIRYPILFAMNMRDVIDLIDL